MILEKSWRDKLLKRFLTYVKIHSTSDPESEDTPSTPQQWDMAKLLFKELKDLGLEEVSMDENGYVMACIPSNSEKNLPQIGFIAHYDSSPDYEGRNINPKVFEKYDGSELILNEETGFRLSPKKFKELANYVGQTIICTDGNTLLSADDKAGVAEIVTAAEYLMQHPEIKHGRISVGFTPDEEIGRGAHKFDIKKFSAQWAYTMDGGEIGELEYENFNAAEAFIHIKGISVHPGYAFSKMLNASLLASEFIQMLPKNETPSTTVGYEGFFHLMNITSNVSSARLHYIIRDHDENIFEQRKRLLKDLVANLNEKYGEGCFSIEIKEQYLNMKKQLVDKMHIVDLAEKAMIKCGVNPKIKAIRGGTDGAQLSYMGLPCPNIFAGGHNFHGPYEFVPLESMLKAVEVILNISQLVEE